MCPCTSSHTLDRRDRCAISFFGFALTKASARGDDDDLGWYFVFEEQPSEPRFGLDEVDPDQFNDSGPRLAVNELGWGHLVSESEYERLAHVPVATARPKDWSFTDKQGRDTGLSWTGGAAHLAALTLQRPARVAIHAARLLREDG